jgi:hypothetical protein
MARVQKLSQRSAFEIGFLARICPEKGLHLLVDAFLQLAKESDEYRLKIAGYLGKKDEAYCKDLLARIESAGLKDRCEFWGEVSREDKIRFLNSIDVLSVPTTYREPKGLFVLEAWANGVPVVQPQQGLSSGINRWRSLVAPIPRQHLKNSVAQNDPNCASAGRTMTRSSGATMIRRWRTQPSQFCANMSPVVNMVRMFGFADASTPTMDNLNLSISILNR